jgi:hypothetical protein
MKSALVDTLRYKPPPAVLRADDGYWQAAATLPSRNAESIGSFARMSLRRPAFHLPDGRACTHERRGGSAVHIRTVWAPRGDFFRFVCVSGIGRGRERTQHVSPHLPPLERGHAPMPLRAVSPAPVPAVAPRALEQVAAHAELLLVGLVEGVDVAAAPQRLEHLGVHERELRAPRPPDAITRVDREMALERWTTPTRSRRTCSPRYGLQSFVLEGLGGRRETAA